MLKKIRMLLALALAAVLCFAAVGCQPNTDQEGGAPVVESGKEAVQGNEGEEAEEMGGPEHHEVVVIGGGLGGLTAAAAAGEAGADVVLYEKLNYVGGNSILATGVFYAGATDIQAAAGIEDTAEAFYEDAMATSDGKRDPLQTRLIAEHGAEMMDWLQSLGVEFSEKVTPAMGSAVARAHQALPDSATYLNVIREAAEERGAAVELGTEVTEILFEGDAAIGVALADGRSVYADKIVLACGGFGADPDRLVRLCPAAEGILYAGSVGTTGELIEQLVDLGAQTMDIDVPWYTPTVELEKNQLLTSLLLSKGGILLDKEGNRFTDETASYYETGLVLLELETDYVWEVLDDQVRESVYKVDEYVQHGLLQQADSIEELAEAMGVDLAALQATIDTYNHSVQDPASDPFGRTIYGTDFSQPPFYYAKVMTGTVMTPGGLYVNENYEVQKADGGQFENLYAVGEAVGGYRAYGYVGGDSLTHAAVSGMLAGRHAAGAIS